MKIRGHQGVPGVVAVTLVGIALTVVVSVAVIAVSPEWAKRNMVWLLVTAAILIAVSIGLVVFEARRRDAASVRAAAAERNTVVEDLPPVLQRDVAASTLPSVLLSAERAIAPWRDRNELTELDQWCTAADGPTFFVLTGPALVGKTRLVQRLAETLLPPWQVGRLRHMQSPGDVAKILAVPGRHLVVVELGEPHKGIEGFLDEVVGASSERLRVLLIARSHLWIIRRVAECTGLTRGAVAGAQHLTGGDLRPYGCKGDLARWQREAKTAFAQELGCPLPTFHFRELALGTPMGVLQATVLATLLTSEEQLDDESTTLSGILAAHEMRHWPVLVGTEPGSELPRQCFAAAWLLGAQTRSEARPALRRVPDLIEASEERISQVADWLATVHPGSAKHSIIYPLDMISHAIAIPPLAEDDRALLDSLIADLGLVELSRVASQLLNAHPQFPEAAHLAEECLSHSGQTLSGPQLEEILRHSPATRTTDHLLAAIITKHPPDHTQAVKLLAQLNDQPGLENAAAAIYTVLLNHARTEGDPATIAAALHILARVLGSLGRYEDALTHEREALDLFRGLAAEDPTGRTPELARALNNVGNSLGFLGDFKGALKHHRKALGLFRGLAADNPTLHNADLARTLGNVGGSLGSLGDYNNALTHERDALRVWQVLAADNTTHNDDLAGAWGNVGQILWSLGDYNGALTHHREALALFRGLAADNPTLHNGNLASTLSNIGISLGSLGDYKGALTHERDALALFRGLAADNPTLHNDNLASTLSNIGISLGSLGDYKGALTHHRDALALIRGLAADNPTLHNGNLASTLSNIGSTLWHLEDYEDALTHQRDAFTLFQGLAAENPALHDPKLATTQQALSDLLRRLGREDEIPLIYLPHDASTSKGNVPSSG